MSYGGGVKYNAGDDGKEITLDNSADKTIFDIGLSLGYQHYFGEEVENHGIRSSFFIGAGTPYNGKKENILSFENVAKEIVTDGVNLKTQIIPLKTRIELDYLWDFFQKEKHTIGLDAGFGYELGVWFSNGEAKRRYTYTNPTNRNVVQHPTKTNKIPTKTLMTHNFYPKIGLHYYYGNHQFNIVYKFGGIFNGTTNDRKLLLKPDEQTSLLDLDYKESIQSSPSYFSFGYSYRF